MTENEGKTELSREEVVDLAQQLRRYADQDEHRPAHRWLCFMAAETLDAALDGDVDADFAGDVVDLLGEIFMMQVTPEGSC